MINQTRRLLTRAATVAAVLMWTAAGPAAADVSWAGSDPTSNFTSFNQSACFNAGAGASGACLSAAVAALDQARAWLGKPPYVLPRDFDSLTPGEQEFVLADLDRVQYGLTPIPGISGGLSADAAAGVTADADPRPSASGVSDYTSNWAGGYPNVLYAYLGWMYDDGPGSNNEDCTPANTSGCWGHRHDILSQFNPTVGPLAMGVAAGEDRNGKPGYTMLLAQLAHADKLAYTYTWAQALADGASTPYAAAPTRYVSVTLGRPQLQQGGYLSFTARLSAGAGTVNATAASGGSTVRFSVSRVGPAFRCLARLHPGTWRLTVTVAAQNGFRAPPPTVLILHLIPA